LGQEKKQSRSERKLIGKIDPATGKIVPTRPYKKKGPPADERPSKPGPPPIVKMQRGFYGATYLFDEIGKITGITDDLKNCFPETYRQILSVAYYLILEENNSLSRFSHWQKLHLHPYGEDIPSQRSSELFQSIDEEGRMSFFRKQGKRRIEREYWAFDITSISSYSEALSQVKKGKNKEHDRLPQINLALVFGEQSGLPFYYRKLPGNITDVTTVKQLVREFDILGCEKVKVVLDRGFYSRNNINALYQNHQKFIIGVRLGLQYVVTAKNYGYFALLSNEVKAPYEALSLYRSKDVIEKAFGDLKERLNFRRMQVSSELSLNGKLFVEFVALIYLSYVKKKMQDANLFEKWTLQGLLDELDTIELFEAPEHGRILGEVAKKQTEIYHALEVKPLSL